MATHHLTTDAALGWATRKWLSSIQGIREDRIERMLPATKYNVLVSAFNISTALLVTAVVAAIFLAFTKAFVVGAIGLGLRYIADREIDRHAAEAPVNLEVARDEDRGVARLFQRIGRAVMHALPFGGDRNQQILANMGVQGVEANELWVENFITFEDFSLWRHRIAGVEQQEPRIARA